MLIGIVEKNAIMMIDFAIETEREGRATALATRSPCYGAVAEVTVRATVDEPPAAA